MPRHNNFLGCDRCGKREDDPDPGLDPVPAPWREVVEYCKNHWCEGHLMLYCSDECAGVETVRLNGWADHPEEAHASSPLMAGANGEAKATRKVQLLHEIYCWGLMIDADDTPEQLGAQWQKIEDLVEVL
jgi:hypothetical protein